VQGTGHDALGEIIPGPFGGAGKGPGIIGP